MFALDYIIYVPPGIRYAKTIYFMKFKLLLCVMLTVLSVQCWGQTFTAVNKDKAISYNILSETMVEVIALESGLQNVGDGSQKYMGNITIPEVATDGATKKTYAVTRIGAEAFFACFELALIELPATVTSIGEKAFTACGLTSITIPERVTSIGEQVFGGCLNLTSVTALGSTPASVTSTTFSGIPTDAVLYVPKTAFEAYTNSDWSTYFKGGIKAILSVGDTFLEGGINYKVLSGTTVEVVALGSGKYTGNITIPGKVIGYTVTQIGASAFQNCSDLTSITIPESVTSIGARAFDACSSLTSVTIPKEVTSIGVRAFGYCTKLQEINVNSGNGNYSSIEGVLFNKTQSTICQYPTGRTGANYDIPEKVTSIGSYTFSGSAFLSSVSIPTSVTKIENDAFSEIKQLLSITIPEKVTSIGSNTFFGCSALTSVTILSTKSVGVGVSIFSGCSALSSITIYASTPLSVVGFSIPASASPVLYVPLDAEAVYSTTTGWKAFPSIVGFKDNQSNIVISSNSKIAASAPTTTYVKIINGQTASKVTSIDLTDAKEEDTQGIVEAIIATTDLNPNCLIYTAGALTGHNVINVINGASAAVDIVLTSGHDFCCPKEFTASSISYTYTPALWAGKVGGWESIVLPFTAKKYKATPINGDTSQDIYPITATEQGWFWARALNADGSFTDVTTTEMEANTPYIVAFPDEAAFPDNGLNGNEITFYAEGEVSVLATSAMTPKTSVNYAFTGNYKNQPLTCWKLNTEGDAFVRTADAQEVSPFTAYLTAVATHSAAPERIYISDKPTSLELVTADSQAEAGNLLIFATPGEAQLTVLLKSDTPMPATLYSESGIVIARLQLEPGSNPLPTLPAGTYFLNNQRFIVQ